MSYTAILAIWPGEKYEKLEELRNSHGSAPIVWDAMCKRYLGKERNWLLDHNELWPLYKRLNIPKSLRAVLMMTYDRAYVLKKDYAQAANDIHDFLNTCHIPLDYVNHWPHIANLFSSNPEVPAIGFQMTSVSNNLFQGLWNEETKSFAPIDWSECWSVYDRLPLQMIGDTMPSYYKESVCFGENNEYRIVKDFKKYNLYHKEYDVDKTQYWKFLDELFADGHSHSDKALISLFRASKKDVEIIE